VRHRKCAARKLRKILDALTFREREIIKLRYGLGDGYTYTLEEVGRKFKVTRERVRRIEAKMLRKLEEADHAVSKVRSDDVRTIPEGPREGDKPATGGP